MVVDILGGFIVFMLVGWPMLTYAADAVRYVVWWLKGVRYK